MVKARLSSLKFQSNQRCHRSTHKSISRWVRRSGSFDQALQAPATAWFNKYYRRVFTVCSSAGTLLRAAYTPPTSQSSKPVHPDFVTWDGGFGPPNPLLILQIQKLRHQRLAGRNGASPWREYPSILRFMPPYAHWNPGCTACNTSTWSSWFNHVQPTISKVVPRSSGTPGNDSCPQPPHQWSLLWSCQRLCRYVP